MKLYKIILIALVCIITAFISGCNNRKTKLYTTKYELQVDTLDYLTKYKSQWDAVEDSLKKRAFQNDAKALYQLGSNHQEERERKDNSLDWVDSIEFAYFSKAADLGHLKAIYTLATLYYPFVDKEKAELMISEWKCIIIPRAENGDAESQLDLAVALFNEDNQSKAAREWARKSALQCYAKGEKFYADIGPKDESDFWYKKAAQNGDVYAMRLQGKAEEKKGNYTKAISLYRKICMKEPFEFDAHLALADMYYYGRGVRQNYKVAVSWYEYIAKFVGSDDVAEACLKLSACYRFGRGVAQDEKQADRWLAKAQEYAKTHDWEEVSKRINSINKRPTEDILRD